MKAYAIRVAMEEEHLPVALQRAEQVVAPQQDAPNVRSCGMVSGWDVLCAGRDWGWWSAAGGMEDVRCLCWARPSAGGIKGRP